MKIIIVGGGKVGYYLAKTLLEHRHEPTIIERKKNVCAMLANDLDIPTFCGDGTSLETLVSAGIEQADAFVAVTGGDETNLVACELAKGVFRIKRTVAKANNPKNAEVMKKLGIDITVSSTAHIARLIEQEVDLSAIKQLVSINQGESSINEVLLPENFRFSGRQLMDLKLPEQSIIVAIDRGGEVQIPRGNTCIYAGDKLLIMAKNSALHKVKEKLHLDD
jgi:trk system potassium uptake protein TrkA